MVYGAASPPGPAWVNCEPLEDDHESLSVVCVDGAALEMAAFSPKQQLSAFKIQFSGANCADSDPWGPLGVLRAPLSGAVNVM